MSEGLTLLVRIGSRHCGLELQHVVETMRPLPIEPILGTPEFVLGVSLIRGEVTPVVDLATAIGSASSGFNRFVVVTTGERKVALAVDDVIGVRYLADGSGEISPLVTELKGDVISTIEKLDAQLLLVLSGASIVPESTWLLIEGMVTQ